MRLGTSYYPELVSDEEWERDLDLIVEAGLDHLRLLDFAWSAIEPREGEYHWDWLDRFIDLASARGLDLILCTPTASPPAWLARQFPEIMLADRRQQPRPWGNRREGDVENPIYIDFCAGIAEVLARRYGRHPSVIGWQLDNELVGSELLPPENHSRVAQWRFRRYLKRVHQNLETLNGRWGMRFWNQAFSAWGEIETPHHDRPCQGHWLDYCRHFSEVQRDFLRAQAEAMRPHLRDGVWISHNSTAVFDRGLDHRVFAEALDLVGWDAYPGAAAGRAGVHPADFTALAHDLFRSTFLKPFWVFETASFDRPGVLALVAEAFVRGAEGVCFWHWRAHQTHVERGCSTFCDYAGRPFEDRVALLRRLREDPHLQALPGSVGRSPVAFWYDVDNVRDELRPNPYRRQPFDHYLRAVGAWARALRRVGLVPDVVHPGDSLAPYRLIVIPRPVILSIEDGRALTEAVRAGAVLAGSAPAAYYDRWGRAYGDLGEPLRALLGHVQREEWRNVHTMSAAWQGDEASPVMPEGDCLARIDGEVLARVVDGAWAGAISAYRRSVERGHVVFLPLWNDRLCERAVELAARLAGLETRAPVEGVGWAPDPLGRGWWAFNNGSSPTEVEGRRIDAGEYALI